MPATKDTRLELRLRPDANELIRRAAMTTDQSVTDFVTSAAIDRAHEVLADQRTITLHEGTWAQFVALLEGPVDPDQRLAALFSRPARITR